MQYSINPLEAYLQKSVQNFTKKDIIKYVTENSIRIINFRYPAHDGRLKTLSFPIQNLKYLDTILTYGERVDGSSLFPGISAGSSDLYVIPKYSSAYLSPFSEIPTLGIMCSYFTKDGVPFEDSPEYTLKKAHNVFKEKTGYQFEAMGEIEFYIIANSTSSFKAEDQKGYHESSPFSKFEDFRNQAMVLISQVGGEVKYAHSEVGSFTHDGKYYEQTEIEFLPTNVERAADQLLLAKWIIRTLAHKSGLDVTFAPKITEGRAGSGMHFHTRVVNDGKNLMTLNGELSDIAKRAIAGYMVLAPSITAFGNTNPTSYFRLVPNQEAPTKVCWGDRNRSVLVRVPLGWTGNTDMSSLINNNVDDIVAKDPQKQTVELRSPDGSADIYLTLASIVVAATYGLTNADSLGIASETYVDVNIHKVKGDKKIINLKSLPSSCFESSEELKKHKDFYLQNGVFSESLLNTKINSLLLFDDKELRAEIEKKSSLLTDLVAKFYHCG